MTEQLPTTDRTELPKATAVLRKAAKAFADDDLEVFKIEIRMATPTQYLVRLFSERDGDYEGKVLEF